MLTFSPTRAVFSCLFLFLGFASTVGAQCTHPDVPALETIFNATSGNDWTNKAGWLSDCEPCGWVGVNCDSDDRVVSIKLSRNGLTGQLPSTFNGLDRLEVLDLGWNEIEGDLPAALFTLTALKELRLSGNMFTGSLPAAVGQLTELEELRLQTNQLAGDLPSELSGLLSLKVLMMSFNSFTGSIPEGFGDLPELQVLGFTNNDLSGCFPLDLTSMCEGRRILFGGNDKLSWKGDFNQLCVNGLTDTQIGSPCDDGNPDTGGDIITDDCGCRGAVTDGLVGLDAFTEEDAVDIGQDVQQVNPLLGAPGTLSNVASAVYEVAVFPNPIVGNEITVTLPNDAGNSTLRLLSMTGRELLQQASSQTSTVVNLPVLEAGMYIVEVVTEGNRSVKRVMVQ